MQGKPYVTLDAYELGQITALLPDVAWNRMDPGLRRKIKEAQKQAELDRERFAQRVNEVGKAEG